jgi:DNA-binding transcriptional ArsR family regulator
MEQTRSPLLSEEDVENSALVLRCLGHPLRLRILDLLDQQGEATVTQIQEGLEVEQAMASQHLANMWNKGILTRRRDGVHVLYGIKDDRARKVLDCVRHARC